ncbi:winged helix-turn-helix transcriptional regulator [Chloroflexota bacterium]
MTDILRDKSLATKFQILVEIAASQPNIRQKEIASKLNVSPQAISQYTEVLIQEGFLTSEGRYRYSVTREAVNWMLKMIRELNSYSASVKKVVTNITICTAAADCELHQGQAVALEMKNGVLVATIDSGQGAKGIAVSDARKGEDVGVSNVEGIVPLETARITILKVPGIQRGGSNSVSDTALKREMNKNRLTGIIGIEALVMFRRSGIEPRYLYGVTEAAIEAARSGLAFLIACTEDAIPDLLKKLEEEGIGYELLDVSRP